MSGITPILDTLLHQVLGKRVEVPLVRTVPHPVPPALPARAPLAVRGEARLNPGATAAGESVRSGAPSSSPPSSPAPPTPAGAPAPGASTRIHFSAAARTIAEVLAHYPAPPSTVRAPAPLLPARPVPGDGASATRLAAALRASVEHSGLFHESHLQRWFERPGLQGERSLQRLSREPQTQWLADAKDGVFPARHRQRLHDLLRHQLEVLANPVLRWRGEAWPEAPMTLWLAAPEADPADAGVRDDAHRRDADHDHEEPNDQQRQRETADAAASWRSEIALALPALGRMRARLTLVGERLELRLTVDRDDIRPALRAAADPLRDRLREVGAQSVRLTIQGPDADD